MDGDCGRVDRTGPNARAGGGFAARLSAKPPAWTRQRLAAQGAMNANGAARVMKFGGGLSFLAAGGARVRWGLDSRSSGRRGRAFSRRSLRDGMGFGDFDRRMAAAAAAPGAVDQLPTEVENVLETQGAWWRRGPDCGQECPISFTWRSRLDDVNGSSAEFPDGSGVGESGGRGWGGWGRRDGGPERWSVGALEGRRAGEI